MPYIPNMQFQPFSQRYVGNTIEAENNAINRLQEVDDKAEALSEQTQQWSKQATSLDFGDEFPEKVADVGLLKDLKLRTQGELEAIAANTDDVGAAYKKAKQAAISFQTGYAPLAQHLKSYQEQVQKVVENKSGHSDAIKAGWIRYYKEQHLNKGGLKYNSLTNTSSNTINIPDIPDYINVDKEVKDYVKDMPVGELVTIGGSEWIRNPDGTYGENFGINKTKITSRSYKEIYDAAYRVIQNDGKVQGSLRAEVIAQLGNLKDPLKYAANLNIRIDELNLGIEERNKAILQTNKLTRRGDNILPQFKQIDIKEEDSPSNIKDKLYDKLIEIKQNAAADLGGTSWDIFKQDTDLIKMEDEARKTASRLKTEAAVKETANIVATTGQYAITPELIEKQFSNVKSTYIENTKLFNKSADNINTLYKVPTSIVREKESSSINLISDALGILHRQGKLNIENTKKALTGLGINVGGNFNQDNVDELSKMLDDYNSAKHNFLVSSEAYKTLNTINKLKDETLNKNAELQKFTKNNNFGEKELQNVLNYYPKFNEEYIYRKKGMSPPKGWIEWFKDDTEGAILDIASKYLTLKNKILKSSASEIYKNYNQQRNEYSNPQEGSILHTYNAKLTDSIKSTGIGQYSSNGKDVAVMLANNEEFTTTSDKLAVPVGTLTIVSSHLGTVHPLTKQQQIHTIFEDAEGTKFKIDLDSENENGSIDETSDHVIKNMILNRETNKMNPEQQQATEKVRTIAAQDYFNKHIENNLALNNIQDSKGKETLLPEGGNNYYIVEHKITDRANYFLVDVYDASGNKVVSHPYNSADAVRQFIGTTEASRTQ